MAQFLSQFGIELVLLLYGILTTILNVVTFRRTGKLVKPSQGVTEQQTSVANEKLVKKIDKARLKLEKLLSVALPKDGE